MQEEDYVE